MSALDLTQVDCEGTLAKRADASDEVKHLTSGNRKLVLRK